MIITLTGSSRFLMAYDYWNDRLSFDGNLVFSYVPLIAENRDMTLLQLIQKWKIAKSDLLFVIDCASLIDMQSYIGQHTKEQIDFASAANLTIVYASNVLMKRSSIKLGEE